MGDDKGPEIDPNAWMVTFADLIMLLLTFFVMLLTMKAMDKRETAEMFDKFIESEGAQDLGGYYEDLSTPDSASIGTRKRTLHLTSNAMLKKALKKDYENFRKYFDVKEDERGLVIILDTEYLFESGLATLRPGAPAILDMVGQVIKKCSNDVLVIGHTDNTPIQSEKYRSNWELSSHRALAVHTYLTRSYGIEEGRLAPGGYGENKPLVPNTSPEGRSKNRRVEFIVKK